MTHYLIKNLKQTATYWGSPVASGSGGYTFASPVAVDVRWEKRQELFITAEGKEELSKAVVYIGQDVVLNGYLYLGTSTEANPKDQEGSFEIRAFSKIPTLKGNYYQRKIWL